MATYTELSYDEAEIFVKDNAHRGYFWDGWDIVRWVPNANGFFANNGMFRNNKWGYSFRSSVNSEGKWKLKNV